jgi:hypothetical protein
LIIENNCTLHSSQETDVAKGNDGAKNFITILLQDEKVEVITSLTNKFPMFDRKTAAANEDQSVWQLWSLSTPSIS